MSWLLNLYKTYELNADRVGEFEEYSSDQNYTLLPIAHTTQQIQVEVVVNEKGDFLSAQVVDENDATTIIPCTEDSFSRTSAPVPHPLHDSLQYVAGDYEQFVQPYKKGKNLYQDYINQLGEWASSSFAHKKIIAIYSYVRKGTLIHDLVQEGVLHVDQNQKLISKWKNSFGEKPDIFKVINETQEKAYVRFDVHLSNEVNTKVWKDKDVFDSFINYYKSTLSEREKDICYVSGSVLPKTEKHSSKIRHAADRAKLISSNDSINFTYKGRFKEPNEAANISYDVSQKAHQALKWLIQKQGEKIDQRVFLVWGNDETKVAAPQKDTLSFFHDLGIQNPADFLSEDRTHEGFAKKVNQALAGYKKDLKYNQKSEVNILVLDSATSGRMAVVYYRNLQKEKYLENIESWHKSCSWLHRYKNEDKKIIEFIRAPALKEIAQAAYGPNVKKEVQKGLVERLLPCIIERRNIPLDIIRSVYNRASNPVSMETWQWEQTLSIACALMRKQYEKEEYNVSLDLKNTHRDYLFGRLLAIADVLERKALSDDSKRATNAIRYMNAFARHPARTWEIIQANLQPYQARLGDKAIYFNRLIDEVGSKIRFEDFNNKPLSGIYLLGFYSQRYELYNYKSNNNKNEGDEKHETFAK
ncbi:CRISPR-associated Csd1 family protein [Melghiribacillus thermohalophilus]|uniref:CRISPR-associated Csd1 family protein n=1 Tax=Melghiribacillus thermohalophilus TaxID=1324956 RepID=A0A4R3N1I3_9BACI|nr:type I-C CRISPR-associated protein Cas8c/Csd1 [Melghiribacillus thermohalophilus]TCT21776.1 CRISPR-associated Csd1 family protein [Melghiribacillus thermohalophilus]